MSTKYLFAAIQARTQDPIAKVILIYLADSANQEGICWPSHKTIADMCETSVKTVRRKLDELVVMGYLDWENRTHKGFKASNVYQLCDPDSMMTNGRMPDDPIRIRAFHKMGQPDPAIGHSDLSDGSQRPIEPISNLNTTTTTRPSVEQVQEYVATRDIKIDPQQFIDYYTANGWKVGRNTMKDWKAAVRTWERREKTATKNNGSKQQSTRQTTLEQDLTDRSWAQ